MNNKARDLCYGLALIGGVTLIGVGSFKAGALEKECSPVAVQLQIIKDRRPNMGPLEADFWQRSIALAAAKYNLPAPEMTAKIAEESGFYSYVKSGSGAQGVSQLMPMHTKDFNPIEIEPTLDKGMKVFAEALTEMKGHMRNGFRRYNGSKWAAVNKHETEFYAAMALVRVYEAERKVCKPSA